MDNNKYNFQLRIAKNPLRKTVLEELVTIIYCLHFSLCYVFDKLHIRRIVVI